MKTFFLDGDLVARLPGTRVLAAWLNKVFNHRHDGKDEDGSAPLDYAADTGATNALAIALTPALTAHVTGMPLWLKVAADNNGAATLKVNDLAAAPIVKLDGQALEAGDLKAGQIIGVSWTGTAYQLTNYQAPPVTDASTLNGQTAAQITPPGAVMGFAMPTVPSGWLLCDGRPVLRATYPGLWAAIGTTWGAGDNVSTFNLPDLRGEFLRGWDNGRGVDDGREFGDWQADELKAHRHPVYTSTADGTDSGESAGFGIAKSFDTPVIPGGTAELQEAALGAIGGAETRPRNLTVLYCIKY